MRILLIQPYGEASNTNYPPLGLLYLASYLRKHTKHEVKILDIRLYKKPIEEFFPQIKSFNPDIIGLTGMSIEWSGFRHTANAIDREFGKNSILISGGPHSTVFPYLVMQKTPVKYIIRGEGEITFLEFLNALEKNEDLESVKGLVIKRSDGKIIFTPSREAIKDVDSIPFPAYDLLDLEEYFRNPHIHSNLFVSNRSLPLFTSRGCPFKCKYCFHPMGYNFRPRSVENVLDEIDWLVKEYNVKEFQIEDDTFNFDMDRAKEIMRQIIKRGYNFISQ